MRMYLDYFLARFGLLRGDRKGVTALEYAVIAAVTVVAVAGAIAGVGTKLTTLFSTIETSLG